MDETVYQSTSKRRDINIRLMHNDTQKQKYRNDNAIN